MKEFRLTVLIAAALLLLGAALLSVGQPVSAHVVYPSPPGPTAANCFSDAFHAASDCDRIASGPFYLAIAVTGGESAAVGPTSKDCYSTAFHAASDCDRIVSSWR